MTSLTFGSCCSGIEAASVAFNPLGWQAAWFSEIDPFCNALLRHHYPDVPNWTDMTLLRHMIRAGLVAAPDVLCGGTPCQAFSVAGLRESLNDARGNLTLEFVKVADAIDQQRNEPCVVLWENVPGVLTTDDNAFGAFLGGLVGDDNSLSPPEPLPAAGKSSRRWRWKDGRHVPRWPGAGVVVGPTRTAAWRTFDAQFFGLAQRRRRVFVVASARKWFDPGSVLLEWEGLRRDTAPSREAGQDTAGGAAQCAAFGGNNTSGAIHISPALNASASASGRLDFESEAFLVAPVAHTLRGAGFDASEDGTGRGTPLVVQGVDYRNASLTGAISGTLEAAQSKGNREQGVLAFSVKDHGGDASADLAPTLRAMGHGGSHANGGGQLGVLAFNHNAQAAQLPTDARDCTVTPPLTCSQWAAAVIGPRVRRLTPRECERLQGFQWQCAPDHPGAWCDTAGRWWTPDYTLLPGRVADGPRYKALGNSWAVPNIRWIGRRIAAAINTAKMLS